MFLMLWWLSSFSGLIHHHRRQHVIHFGATWHCAQSEKQQYRGQ